MRPDWAGSLTLPEPNIMQIIVTIYGRDYPARILRSHPAGTVDVQLADGRCFRVSGLATREP